MWNLAISEDTAQELYPSMDLGIFKRKPKNDEDFIQNFLPSKLWRLNNLYSIVDKYGERMLFKMNWSQHYVYSRLLRHPRLIILKSRQQGISTFFLISYFDDAVFVPDLTVGLMAQGKAEASTLLQRVKLAWDELDSSIKGFLALSIAKDNSEEVAFDNGSTVFIRTSFRSTTLQRLHISEYGKIANKYPEKARETKTGTLQAIAAGNPVVIESTAEGDNDFKAMWDAAYSYIGDRSPKDFAPVFLSWLNDSTCVLDTPQTIDSKANAYFDSLGVPLTDAQKWFWVAQYRELGDDIYQEYPSTPEEAFAIVRDGAYYAKLYTKHVTQGGRERDGLWDPNLEVHVAIDLGMNDDMVLVFFQWWKNEWRIVDEYRNSSEGISHYVNIMAHRKSYTGELYKLGTVILPHDVKVRDLSTGQTRLARFRELGVRRIKVLPRIPVNDGIEAVRRIIPNLYIDKQCTYLISCLKNYSKEWDDKLNVWKDKPLHNEYSHGADVLRYMAMGLVRRSDTDGDYPTRAGRKQYVVDGLAL
jgi:hypothetical protein